ncbi:MAG: DNA primase [Thermoanaerobaculia bacterium]
MTDFLDFNDRVLSDIRSAADIVEVIGEHTTLKKAGNSWKGLCPFHREKTPSFTVNRDRGLFYCFGCGAGGDLFGFVRQMERATFREAAEILARRYGVEVPRRVRGEGEDRRERLLSAVASAHRLYRENLGPGPNRATEYLRERGVPEETARELELGFAPDSWDFLSRLTEPPEILIEAGILQPGAPGKRPYDRFRNRLLFPIRDERGRVVGFGGRSLSGEEPKYLNSPDSPVFSKNRLLYGIPAARDGMRRADRAVLVEGYFDHLGLLLSGVPETVASMGTSLGRPQAEKLRKWVSRAVLCYDGDSAGRTATRRAIPLLLSEGLEVRVAAMPAGSDPFDRFREGGAEAVRSAVDDAAPFLDWLLSSELAPASSPKEKGDRVNAILEVLESIPDRVVRYEFVRRLAEAASMPVDLLWKAPRAGARAPAAEGTNPPAESLNRVRPPEGERRLLRCLLNGRPGSEEEVSHAIDELDPEVFTDPACRSLFLALRKSREGGGETDFSRLGDLLREEREFVLLSEVSLDESPEGVADHIEPILNALQRRHLERQAETLQRAIEAAGNTGNQEEIDELLRSKTALSEKIKVLARSGARRKTC